MRQSVKVFKCFQHFNFKANFLGSESIFPGTSVLVLGWGRWGWGCAMSDWGFSIGGRCWGGWVLGPVAGVDWVCWWPRHR